ncbi:cupin domain-containing protein [Streptomyces sp. UP1A-1]|nr:cupin domain-containing protein [Streptomyces sp. UP1A-1]
MTEEVNTGGPQPAPAVSVTGPGEGETIVLGSTRMRVLEDGSHTGHRLAIAESVLAPHTQGPPQHRHGRHDEGFYVLSGTVRFTVGAEVHDATPGTLVMVPPGVPHTFANPTDRLSRHAQHLHPRLLRAVLPGSRGGARRRPAADAGGHPRPDEPLRHRARRRPDLT